MEQCELVVIGAGYAGINAFNAASKYLSPGSRIVVIDRGYRWGGQWPNQYGFVRLHQGYRSYTAGERKWLIKRPETHLATKDEILQHFDNVVDAVISETGIKLVTLFGYEHDGLYKVQDGTVRLMARSLMPNVPDVEVVASKMIKAPGFDLRVKRPLSFGLNVDSRMVSLRPGDLASPQVQASMRYGGDDRLIVVVGSGKTAMDCMLKLISLGDNVVKRLRCIAGRGTWFCSREVFATPAAPSCILAMLDLYDGSNGVEVCATLAKRGFLHSAIPDPTCFGVGVCSDWEIKAVREALTPVQDKVVKAHLLDTLVDPSGEGTLLQLRPVSSTDDFTTLDTSASTTMSMPLPAGSFLVNCTDQIGEHSIVHDPIVSDDGLVLSPQGSLGFSGPSADLITHAWYRGVLGDTWKQLPRTLFSKERKADSGISAFFLLMFSVNMITSLLPPELVAANQQLNPEKDEGSPLRPEKTSLITIESTEEPGAGQTCKQMPSPEDKMKELLKKFLTLYPHRYDDKLKEVHTEKSVLMGNIGLARDNVPVSSVGQAGLSASAVNVLAGAASAARSRL